MKHATFVIGNINQNRLYYIHTSQYIQSTMIKYFSTFLLSWVVIELRKKEWEPPKLHERWGLWPRYYVAYFLIILDPHFRLSDIIKRKRKDTPTYHHFTRLWKWFLLIKMQWRREMKKEIDRHKKMLNQSNPMWSSVKASTTQDTH